MRAHYFRDPPPCPIMSDAVRRRASVPRRLAALAVLALATPVAAFPQNPQAKPPSALIGTWRVIRRAAAPWTGQQAATTMREWIGQTIRFTPTRVIGPSVLRCERATLVPTRVPAEGLFQGGLAAPAEPAARSLGIGTFPVPGVQLTCDTGVFEFHQADAQSMLTALDNVILTLDRSPGSLAGGATPSGIVQRFLEAHFDGDMAFDTLSLATKRQYLSDSLAAAIVRYARRPQATDQVPDINGDPFTDSQEYPTRFSVGTARVVGARTTVPVRFSDAYRSNRVTYHLRRTSAGGWRIDDVVDARGESLRALLR